MCSRKNSWQKVFRPFAASQEEEQPFRKPGLCKWAKFVEERYSSKHEVMLDILLSSFKSKVLMSALDGASLKKKPLVGILEGANKGRESKGLGGKPKN